MAVANPIRLAVVLTSLFCLSCVHEPDISSDPLRDVWDNPLRHEGDTFEVIFYPRDYGSSESYTMCFEPCSQLRASRELAVIRPALPGRFDGADGQHQVTMHVTFRAECFRPHALCGHTPYVFEEVR